MPTGEAPLQAAPASVYVDRLRESLQWISSELARTLTEARGKLEHYADTPTDRDAIKAFCDLMHSALGALRMVEVQGAALLVEEMEGVANALFEGKLTSGQDALDSLMQAVVQLPAYLDRIAGGGRDIPLILLPLLNDLRAVRACPLLSENTLFLLNVASDPIEAASGPAPSGEDINHVARRLHPHYQAALLGWLRGDTDESNLGTMSVVAENLQQAATATPLFQLWWVAGAVLEGLMDDGIDAGASMKRLLAGTERQLRRLANEGEAVFESDPPLELLSNLLYYVARADSRGERVNSVKTSFSLAQLLPEDDRLRAARAGLAAPNTHLMGTVAAAIRQDLSAVKDVLDIFVRTGREDLGELVPQTDQLKKIGDTMTVLGLADLADEVFVQRGALLELVTSEDGAAEGALLGVATALLDTEDRLDQQLLALIRAPDVDAGKPPSRAELEFQQVSEAVLRECKVNLARLKDIISQYSANPADKRDLDSLPELLSGISAGLLMLEKERALQVVERVARFVRAYVHAGAEQPSPMDLDRLADAIVSVEYYIETLQAGRSDPWYMLDNAETCLDTISEAEPAGPEAIAATDIIEIAPGQAAPMPGPTRSPILEPLAADARESIDPELLELFIEEAKEEIETISGYFPGWREKPDSREALISLRRCFHTLKGSGRMVGAQILGEFGWAVENLMNRLINRTLPFTPAVVEYLSDAVDALPHLVEQLEIGTPPPFRVEDLIDRGGALIDADRRPATSRAATLDLPHAANASPAADAEVAPADPDSAEREDETAQLVPGSSEPEIATGMDEQPEAAPDEHRPPAEARSEPRMDPALHRVFDDEISARLAVVRQFVDRGLSSDVPQPVEEPLQRAWHSLAGASRTAGVAETSRIADPLYRWVERAFQTGAGVPAEAVQVMADAADAIEHVAHHLILPGWGGFDATALVARIDALSSPGAPQRSIEQATAEDRTAQPVEDPSPEAQPVAPDYDPEIAEIFSEEAGELLDDADRALQALATTPRDAETLGELKRVLHTLKGGARMARLNDIGTISHDLESLLTEVEAGRVLAGRELLDTIQYAIDRLHSMRDRLVAGQPLGDVADVLARLTALQSGPVDVAPSSAPAADEIGTEAHHAGAVPEMVEASDAAEAPEAVETPDAVEAAEAFEAIATADVGETARVSDVADPADPTEVPGEVETGDATEVPDEVDTGGAIEVHDVIDAIEAPEDAGFAEEVEVPAETEDASEAVEPVAVEDTTPILQPVTPAAPPTVRRASLPREELVASRQELARVDAELLDNLLNHAGEVSIFRSRLEQEISSVSFNLTELAQTVTRLRDQLRKLELETEAQILYSHHDDGGSGEEFDPLELDRYSSIQQLSRGLAESVSDLSSIQELMEDVVQESESLLVQQSRVTTELQDGLMRTRMVPFSNHAQRLSRTVRQTAAELGRRAELRIEGGEGELDRQVLERMLPPFEHMLRNAVVHGVESVDERRVLGKPELASIVIRLHREGSQMIVEVEDDGAGLDVAAIKQNAVAHGLIRDAASVSDDEALQLILEPGFSTAARLTQSAGRGVGMDVVANEVRRLGGTLEIRSEPGSGARFTIRLPFTLAITQALLVKAGDDTFAIPLPSVEGIVRVSTQELARYLKEDAPSFVYGGQGYRFQHMGVLLGGAASVIHQEAGATPVILVRAGEYSTALVVGEMLGSREIVVKSVGPQIASVRGVSGATILGDGSIVMILDVSALVRRAGLHQGAAGASILPKLDERPVALVVDDSITVRRVTGRLLERHGWRVLTAKDGIDAIAMLQDQVPDVMLLDIEMPRMDGYEVAAHVRNDGRLRNLPIVMITSRVGDKHRARGLSLGVRDYLGKPYQDTQLLAAIEPFVQGKPR